MVKAEIFGPDTYDSCAHRVNKLTGILLIFHPGCGHCVQMRPDWEQMKQQLPDSSTVVEVDGSGMSEHEGMRNHPVVKNLKGFPSIFRVKNGKVQAEYQGPRTMEEMKKFSIQKARKPINKSSRKASRKGSKKLKRKIDTRKKR